MGMVGTQKWGWLRPKKVVHETPHESYASHEMKAKDGGMKGY